MQHTRSKRLVIICLPFLSEGNIYKTDSGWVCFSILSVETQGPQCENLFFLSTDMRKRQGWCILRLSLHRLVHAACSNQASPCMLNSIALNVIFVANLSNPEYSTGQSLFYFSHSQTSSTHKYSLPLQKRKTMQKTLRSRTCVHPCTSLHFTPKDAKYQMRSSWGWVSSTKANSC